VKKILYSILILVLIIVCFFLYTFVTTGFFRTIVPKPYGEVVQQIPVKGAEDLTINYEEHFMIISSDDRKATKMGMEVQGGLYYVDLNEMPFNPVLLTGEFKEEFHPHGISLWKVDSGIYHLFVINHTKEGHAIEKFRLENRKLKRLLTFRDTHFIVSPNDLVAVDKDRFYVTNDHGNRSRVGIFFENYLGLKISTVGYYDGKVIREVAGGIGYANGINARDQKLFVASPRYFLIKVYTILPDGGLEWSFDIPTGTGVDNLEWDDKGNLWSGGHPNLLRFSTYAALKRTTSPSEVIKVTFDGEPKVESVFTNDGSMISASSVAVPYGDFLFIGNVMDDNILVVKK